MTNYIGRNLDKISNIEILDNITFDGSQSYTLQKGGVNFTPNSAQSIILGIDGITQIGNFSVNGSTIDFGVAVANTSTCNYIIHLGTGLLTAPSDGSVTNAKLGTAPTLEAKGSGGTAGGVKYFCEAGTHGVTIRSPAHANYSGSYELKLPTAQGSANTFLKNDGSGNLSFAEAGGGGLVKLAETNISSGVSTVSFDGYFTSDYDFYKVMVVNLRPVGSSSYVPSLRFRRSNSDVTSNNYRGAVQQAFNGGSNHNGDFPSTLINMVKDSSVKGNSEFGFSAEIIFYNPLKSTRYRMVNGQGTYQYSTDRWYTCQFGGTDYSSTSALSGFTFLNAGGENFDDGEIYLFGMKTS